MLLADRTVIVSGVGPGLGAEIALACAREGADVVLAARTVAMLDEVAEGVRAMGRRALTVPTDVTRSGDCGHPGEAGCAGGGGLVVCVSTRTRHDTGSH